MTYSDQIRTGSPDPAAAAQQIRALLDDEAATADALARTSRDVDEPRIREELRTIAQRKGEAIALLSDRLKAIGADVPDEPGADSAALEPAAVSGDKSIHERIEALCRTETRMLDRSVEALASGTLPVRAAAEIRARLIPQTQAHAATLERLAVRARP